MNAAAKTPFLGARSRRPRVLVSCDHYLPGVKAGGPIRSISGLVSALGGELDFRIVTRDRDLGAGERYAGVRPGHWYARDGAQVLYWPPAGAAPAAWRAVIGSLRPDVVYLNSFFSPRYTLAPLLVRRAGRAPAARFVLAPRGELHPGALAIRSWKKLPFLRLARVAGLTAGVTWHATAEEEATNIRRWFGRAARVVVAPVLAPPAPEVRVARAPKRAGQLEVAFLSRIGPKKNLLGAIEVLRGVTGSVRLNVYGPKEDAAYWERCRRAIVALPPNVRVRDRGPLAAADVASALARSDVLLFPTFGENFGHVVLEALLAGVPVLASDRTPWRGLAAREAGWDVPLEDVAAFRERLAALVAMDDLEWQRWSRGARSLGRSYVDDPGAVARSRELFAHPEAA
ncbi:MAG TPA: glycosyltransferase [Burkholderiales bacterium]|nr:glycosyltransferase [Burkholderiales bacterium]